MTQNHDSMGSKGRNERKNGGIFENRPSDWSLSMRGPAPDIAVIIREPPQFDSPSIQNRLA